MNSQGEYNPWKNDYSISTKSHFESANPVAGCVETMKQPFNDFNQVVICECQETWNEFLGLFNNLKYRFIELTEVAFCYIQKAQNDFSGPFGHV
jgi:hypothetical protein